jgi:nucleoside-diphosphate-sugar epimerase
MRVVVTGATGNLGTSVVSLLSADPTIDSIVGIARRPTNWAPPKVTWHCGDIAVDDLEPLMRGADAVVHLAWLIQPSHEPRVMWAANIVGTRRVAEAVALARVPTLIAASSIGAYSPAPPGHVVDETWPTDGVPESAYSRQKAHEERTLDVLAERHPTGRVVRIRPALIFKREAAREIRNLFIGHLAPLRLLPVERVAAMLERSPIPFQCVHSDDVAAAIHRCLVTDVAGAFNLAAPGVIGSPSGSGPRLARLARPFVAAGWRARLIPIDPGWISLAAAVPLLSTDRATVELDWRPRLDAHQVLRELLHGLRDDATFPTPPLEARRVATDAVTDPLSPRTTSTAEIDQAGPRDRPVS